MSHTDPWSFDKQLSPLFEMLNFSPELSLRSSQLLAVLSLILLTAVTNLLIRFFLSRILHRFVEKTSVKWDQTLLDSGVFKRLLKIVPAWLLYILLPAFLPGINSVTDLLRRLLAAYMIGMIAHALAASLDAVNRIYNSISIEIARKKPIKGYLQMIMIFAYIVAGILMFTTIMNVSPIGILSGLGAMSAVLILVFQNSIMGFVSSLQLSANDMVRIGDWIEMPKYGADGDVIDMTLQTITVRNWDMTYTTIPISALVSDSFKNWRGMSDSPGRRIKRALYIDMQSVRFLDDSEIKAYESIPALSDYVSNKQKDISAHNKRLGIGADDHISGRRMTNLGTFRAYVTAYLQNHSQVQKEMIHMIRYLEPGPTGLPMELYLFCTDKTWVNYERIQADIIDHLLAVLPEFGLRVFQQPSGWNLQALAVQNPNSQTQK
ncbi:mechanosensitive ion channel family protein [Spirochaeta dissipatitropha]